MEQKTGNEHFFFDGMPTDHSLIDFWRWQASDLLNNTLRGALAEFIVAKALDIKTDGTQTDWEPYDLLFNGRWRIEVKSSAYAQSWSETANSNLRFTIRPTRAWTAKDGLANEVIHQSDIYIFCVLSEQCWRKADPLILDQWDFYPVLTCELTQALQNQKTAGLSTVLRLCPEKYDFHSLRDAVLYLLSARTDVEALERINGYNALKLSNPNG